MSSNRNDLRTLESNATGRIAGAEAIDWMELSAEELPDQFDLTGMFSTMMCPGSVSCIPCEPQPMTMGGVFFADSPSK
jgi:hypothetical protein